MTRLRELCRQITLSDEDERVARRRGLKNIERECRELTEAFLAEAAGTKPVSIAEAAALIFLSIERIRRAQFGDAEELVGVDDTLESVASFLGSLAAPSAFDFNALERFAEGPLLLRQPESVGAERRT